MTITVVITTWQVPFATVVREVVTFGGEKANSQALAFINRESHGWWVENDGIRSVDEGHSSPYEPILELGYDTPRYELWGGEAGFEAILDEKSYVKLHDAHYKREYDDKGIPRPGYLRAAMGEDVSAEIAEVFDFFNGKRH